MFTLTPNEHEILSLMWREGRPLVRSEVLNLIPNRSWADTSVHLLLNRMLDKGAIVTDGYKQVGKGIGRAYSAALTENQYMLMQLKKGFGMREDNPLSIAEIFATLMDDKSVSVETIAELEKILRAKEKEL